MAIIRRNSMGSISSDNQNHNNNGLCSCHTAIKIRSCTSSFLYVITCLWMISWTLYSNHSVRNSLQFTALTGPNGVESQIENFVHGGTSLPSNGTTRKNKKKTITTVVSTSEEETTVETAPEAATTAAAAVDTTAAEATTTTKSSTNNNNNNNNNSDDNLRGTQAIAQQEGAKTLRQLDGEKSSESAVSAASGDATINNGDDEDDDSSTAKDDGKVQPMDNIPQFSTNNNNDYDNRLGGAQAVAQQKRAKTLRQLDGEKSSESVVLVASGDDAGNNGDDEDEGEDDDSSAAEDDGKMQSMDNIPIFYNLFVKDKKESSRVRRIVDEQFNKLLPVHHPIYVNSIGVPLDLNDTGAIMLGYHQSAAEHVTLKELWDYCRKPEHDHKKAIYLHSKGSFTSTMSNGKLRRFLTAGALSEECATMPDDQCNICSSRFSPIPHPHTSGNMWLANCNYVKKLIDPEKFEKAMDSLNYKGGKEFLACDGRGRYSAEHWVHSHPSVKPCDLYTDPVFTWNYDGVPVVKTFKQNLKLEKAPRFPLDTYIKSRIRSCPGRGASQKFRIDEYMGLYKEKPSDDWWGYNFLHERDNWWPYREYGWEQLPEKLRGAIIKLGFNRDLWGTKHRSYQLYGKRWTELEDSQRNVLSTELTFDEDEWNKKVAKENRDVIRIKRTIDDEKPNTSFDRCEKRAENEKPSTPWMKKTEQDIAENKQLRDYVFEAPERPANKRRLLIIASVPRDATHLATLWSELECFTEHVNHVIISAPHWGKSYIEHLIKTAIKHIPHFKEKRVTIESKYFLNNRYDVGLWCDAYNSLNNGQNPGVWDEYGLINDSVFALRKFSGIFDNIAHQNLHMTSVSYSYTYKWNKGFGPEEFWVESVYRGFDNKGIDIFKEHSCVAEDHPFFCPGEKDQKACIINNFEHDLAKQYPCDKVQGLYPADSPDQLKLKQAWRRTWIKNTRYWRMLVDAMDFPIAKANEPEQIGTWDALWESKLAWQNEPLLKNCTAHMPWDELFDGLNFKTAKPFYKRRWKNLPKDMQELASKTLGYDGRKWDRAQDSPMLAGKSWSTLSLAMQEAFKELGCSKLQYDRNDCRVQNPYETKEIKTTK